MLIGTDKDCVVSASTLIRTLATKLITLHNWHESLSFKLYCDRRMRLTNVMILRWQRVNNLSSCYGLLCRASFTLSEFCTPSRHPRKRVSLSPTHVNVLENMIQEYDLRAGNPWQSWLGPGLLMNSVYLLQISPSDYSF